MIQMTPWRRLMCLGWLLQASVVFANGGGGMPSSQGSMMGSVEPPSPDELARQAYNSGVRHIKSAKSHDEDAAAASTDEKRAKYAEKARKEYGKALDQFQQAVQQKSDLYEAWNYIGFAKRHLGDYDAALEAYGRALELQPNYADAIEYRGETYLALNRLDAVKDAYMTLFRDARPLSEQLLTAMRAWVEQRHKDAGGVSAEDIDAFSKWVDERGAVAKQTASLAIGSRGPNWPENNPEKN